MDTFLLGINGHVVTWCRSQ